MPREQEIRQRRSNAVAVRDYKWGSENEPGAEARKLAGWYVELSDALDKERERLEGLVKSLEALLAASFTGEFDGNHVADGYDVEGFIRAALKAARGEL